MKFQIVYIYMYIHKKFLLQVFKYFRDKLYMYSV